MRCNAFQLLFYYFCFYIYKCITVLHWASRKGIILATTWGWFWKENSSTKLLFKTTESKAFEFIQLSDRAWKWRLKELGAASLSPTSCPARVWWLQFSPVHSKVEFCPHQCLTLEALQACKGLLSTMTFSRKVKFDIWAILASSSLVLPGVHDVAVSLSVLFMPHLL